MTTWDCALELGADRHVISGSEKTLTKAIGRGADLRIYTEFLHNEHIDVTSDSPERIREVADFPVTYLVDEAWAAGIMTLRQPIELPTGFGPRPSMSFFLYNQNGEQAVARPFLDGCPTMGPPGPAQPQPPSRMPKYHVRDSWDAETGAPSHNFVYDFDVFRYLVSDGWPSAAPRPVIISCSHPGILNGVGRGSFEPTGRILAFGQAGNDNIQVAGSISLSAWLYGDAGDDRLKGGGGHDALFGGLGNDLVVGQSGRDMLVGGRGTDRMVGNADDDILIAGYTAFDYDYGTYPGGILRDSHQAAVHKIMEEWTFVRDYYPEWTPEWDYQTRLKNLTDHTDSTADRRNGEYYLIGPSTQQPERQTVFDDGDRDVLTGSAGVDWFFFNSDPDQDGDRATDLKDEAFGNDLEWILGE